MKDWNEFLTPTQRFIARAFEHAAGVLRIRSLKGEGRNKPVTFKANKPMNPSNGSIKVRRAADKKAGRKHRGSK